MRGGNEVTKGMRDRRGAILIGRADSFKQGIPSLGKLASVSIIAIIPYRIIDVLTFPK